MSEELGAISVGLGVNLGTLDRDLAQVKKRIEPLTAEHKIPFAVGRIDLSGVQREIDRVLNQKVNVNPTFTVNRGNARELRKQLQAQLTAEGPVTIGIKANLGKSEVNRIRSEIARALGSVPISVTTNVTGGGGGGGGGGGAGPAVTPSSPVTTHERRVAEDSAIRTGREVARSIRSSPRAPGTASSIAPVAAPVAPVTPAAAVAAAATRTPRAARTVAAVPPTTTTTAPATPLPAEAAALRVRAPRKRAAAAAPAPADSPDFGVLPTGPSSPIVRRRQTAPVAGALPHAEAYAESTSGPSTTRRITRRLRKRGEERVSPDELRKGRAFQPETPEEIEYASRPMAVSVRRDEQAEFEQEKRGRGVRGASRSGARERHEPVLTDADRLATDNRRLADDTENVATRNREIRDPSRRRSTAAFMSATTFYGSEPPQAATRDRGSRSSPASTPSSARRSERSEAGDEGLPRVSILRGFSGVARDSAIPASARSSSGSSGTSRRCRPSCSRRHAALQALFAQIAQREATKRVEGIEASIAAAKPTRKQNPELWEELSGQRKAALKYQQEVLRGLARREGGGPVRGLPIFGRGLAGIKPKHFGNVGDRFESDHGLQFELQHVPMDDIKAWHGTKPELLEKYRQMAASGSPLPPIIVGPDGKIEDGHHRHQVAREMGAKDMLAYRQRREAGGQVEGSRQGIRVFRGGEVGGRSDFVRQPTSYAPRAAWVALDPAYARRYALGQKRFGRGRKNRFYLPGSEQSTPDQRDAAWALTDQRMRSRGMVHEGVIPASKVTSIGAEHLDRRGLPRLLKRLGYGAVRTDEGGGSLAVFNPRHVVLRLAGPKGPLPREGGGQVAGSTKALTYMAMGGGVFGDSALATDRSGQIEDVSVETLLKYRDVDREKQPRMRNDHGYLDQLTEAMKAGVDLGPVTLDHDPRAPLNTTLFDGNHRLAAALRLGRKTLPTKIRRGGRPSEFGFRAAGGGVEGTGSLEERIRRQEERDPGSSLGGGAYGRWKAQAFRYRPDQLPDHVWEAEYKRYYGEGSTEDDRRNAPSGPTLPMRPSQHTETKVDKLRAMADQSVSPNESAIAKQMLRARGIKGYAGGGRIGDRRGRSYLVGERKPETYVSTSGVIQIIGQKGPEIRQFPEDGKILPYVPAWAAKAAKASGMARAAGGPVRGYGGARFRSFVDGEKEAIASGLLTKEGSSSVQRVFVTNWPATGGASGVPGRGGGRITSAPASAGFAAGPLRFASEKDATKYAEELGGHIGKTLHDLLGSTITVAKGPGPLPTVGPLEKFESRTAARGSVADIQRRITGVRGETAEALQKAPVRALPVAVGQIFSTLFGGRGDILSRARESNKLADIATKLAGEQAKAEEGLRDTLVRRSKAENPEARKRLTDQAREQLAAVRATRSATEAATSKAEEFSKSVVTGVGAVRNLAAGTIGVIGGTLLFGTALGAVQEGITAITTAVGPAIERLTGFRNTEAEVTSAIADQVRQSGGAVKSAVAQSAAQAGLSKTTADLISPLLEQRAQTEAGNKALQDSLKLVHAAVAIRRENGAGGTQVDQGIASTTGGVFGSIVGGIPSTQEQVVNELKTSLPTAKEFSDNRTALDALAQEPRKTLAQSLIDQYGVGAGNVVAPGAPPTNAGAAAQVSSDFSKKLAESTTYVETFQGALDKAGKNFVIDAQKVGESDKVLAARNVDAATAAKAFADAGLLDTAKLIKDTNLVIRDSNGQAIKSADQARQFYLDINKSFTTPDVGELVKQMSERQIPAQKSLFRAQGVVERQTNQAQFALQNIANPIPGTQDVPFDKGIVGKGDAAAKAAAKSYRDQVGGAIGYVNDQIAKGHEALLDLVPPDLRTSSAGSSTTSRRPAGRSPRSSSASSSSRSTSKSPSTTTSCGSPSGRFRTRATSKLGSRGGQGHARRARGPERRPPAPAPAARLRASAAPDQLQARDRRVRRPGHDARGARGADRGGQEGGRVRPEAARHPEAARQQPVQGRQDRGGPVGHRPARPDQPAPAGPLGDDQHRRREPRPRRPEQEAVAARPAGRDLHRGGREDHERRPSGDGRGRGPDRQGLQLHPQPDRQGVGHLRRAGPADPRRADRHGAAHRPDRRAARRQEPRDPAGGGWRPHGRQRHDVLGGRGGWP
jgi:hypothetical protein